MQIHHCLQKSYQISNYEFSMLQFSNSLTLRLLDYKYSRFYEKNFESKDLLSITKGLLQSHLELYTILTKTLDFKSSDSELMIGENGIITYQCFIKFPFEKIIRFELLLNEKELTEIKKLHLQVQQLISKTERLENLFQSNEKLKVLANSQLIIIGSSSPYYQMKEKNKILIRNNNDNGKISLLLCAKLLGQEPIYKWNIKLKENNNNFDYINAYIGVVINPKKDNLSHNDKGVYLITNGIAYFDGSNSNLNAFLFKNDVVSVEINLIKKIIKWEKNDEFLFLVRFREEIKEIKPIIGLTMENESLNL